MRYSTRELVYVGVFGGLWGAIEAGLGSVLHSTGVPFAGAALTAVGMMVALIGRLFVNRRGAVLYIGLVTALVKMLSLGGVVVRPVAGILIESLLAEMVVLVMGPRRAGFACAGSLAVIWSLLHPFLTAGLLAGQPLLDVYLTLVRNGARLVGLPSVSGPAIGFALLAGHAALGAAAGLLAWKAAGGVSRRLGDGGSGPARASGR